MSHRPLWLDDVRRIPYLSTELRSPVRDGEAATAGNHGPDRTGHTPDLRDWRNWGRHLHDRSHAHWHYPLSTIGTLHVIFGTSQLMLLPIAALLIKLSLARNNQTWASARKVLLWTAGLPLFGFLSFAVYTGIFVAPTGPHAYGSGVNIGWHPRFAFFTYMLWLVTLASQAIKCSEQRYGEGDQADEIMLARTVSESRL